MTRPATFREIDLVRAAKAAKRAGLDVARVEIDPRSGKIVISTGRGEPDAENAALDAGSVVAQRLKALQGGRGNG